MMFLNRQSLFLQLLYESLFHILLSIHNQFSPKNWYKDIDQVVHLYVDQIHNQSTTSQTIL